MELVTAPPALLPPDVRGPEGSGLAAPRLAGISGAGDLGQHGFVVAGNRCTGMLDSGEKSSTGGPDGGTAIRVTRGKGEAFDIPAPPPDLLWAKRCKGFELVDGSHCVPTFLIESGGFLRTGSKIANPPE